ncbi:thioesterase family protein [Teredinibacter sp. KSP-S5-2]|uniref:acyl-CoA thioesterase n=1 Tax=Teredinibacter sp. KSP-S5-2 TaxID=3034506 RepID=UPI0029348995|nr:thioesterase family protein [Teredinibacter sp. KSP-S5-2]WNO07717.1 thioesterase family protein [Teredinibacter sp. KSP-S5-2]
MIFETKIEPRFSELDALGHVSNTVLPVWFEHSRGPIFTRIHPSLSVRKWPLILAHYEVSFKQQIFMGAAVTVKAIVSKLGGKSMTFSHQAWQNGDLVAEGTTVAAFYDYKTQETIEIPKETRDLLEKIVTQY